MINIEITIIECVFSIIYKDTAIIQNIMLIQVKKLLNLILFVNLIKTKKGEETKIEIVKGEFKPIITKDRIKEVIKVITAKTIEYLKPS
jgi:hypothetical protein